MGVGSAKGKVSRRSSHLCLDFGSVKKKRERKREKRACQKKPSVEKKNAAARPGRARFEPRRGPFKPLKVAARNRPREA
jgi:hypothetical protein